MNEQEKQFQSGAVIDERPEAEREKDYKFEEIVAAVNPVNWIEKARDQWRKFPIFNQDGSGSCVAQTEAKELGIMRWLKDKIYVHFSATDIYQRRANRPSGGMAAVDARKIVGKGTTLEVLAPSQGMTDGQMDSATVEDYKRKVGEVFAVPNFVEITQRSIDTIASVIQTTGKGVMVWFYFQYDEWTDVPEVKNPNLNLYAGSTNRHSVTAVDFTLYNGKKALIIEDSWGPQFGLNGQRVITEDFFNARCWYAGYLVNFQFEDQTQPKPEPQPAPVNPKPKYRFAKVLTFGMTNADVKALQDILKYEGLFPKNTSSTSYYGAVTAKAVYQFQMKYGVAPKSELDALQGRRVGDKTIAKLNALYAQ
ncbi:MAG: peptidoglycan-binding protein [Candidatus Sungbacteria bacterium]|nr:peptidoglycan-binding protein [Candidatus Sungbacteria bacterium]